MRANLYIDQKLPSEPPDGVTYNFGPSGFMKIGSGSNCYVIPTSDRGINNYCHWNFNELPLLFLCFEGVENKIVLPDNIFYASKSFQKDWIATLKEIYPKKKLKRLTKTGIPKNAYIPINHNTSTNESPIGKSPYKLYHKGRATPYLIDRIENKYLGYILEKSTLNKSLPCIYINRKSRRLVNELEIQDFLNSKGFSTISLEEFSIFDQAYIFNQAETIIGFHGAGLSNLLFSNKNCHVIEIVDKDHVYPCYKDGTHIPGQKATKTYFHMLCKMKNIKYDVLETNQYKLEKKLLETKTKNPLNQKDKEGLCTRSGT
ncbi:glycosyltransferase family 61 protein [Zunongwangia mangrovi]|uniref:glycosyltransferase family 61 protein n=1 Tax=Zunongwangia mangrovi TaxID=1334022 RepID=UPI000B85D567|nr:glycosyltransferase family 61 protein [Zunongwangia mangrovi]